MSAARNRDFCYGGPVGGKARADSDEMMGRPVNRKAQVARDWFSMI